MITPEKLAASGSEQGHQMALFCWAALQNSEELRLMFHIPNGGYRSKSEGASLKAAGVKKGIFDIFLPISRNGFHGLFIEMKALKGVVSEEQKIFEVNIKKQDYCAKICHGWEEARDVILDYLDLK